MIDKELMLESANHQEARKKFGLSLFALSQRYIEDFKELAFQQKVACLSLLLIYFKHYQLLLREGLDTSFKPPRGEELGRSSVDQKFASILGIQKQEAFITYEAFCKLSSFSHKKTISYEELTSYIQTCKNEEQQAALQQFATVVLLPGTPEQIQNQIVEKIKVDELAT